MLLVWLAEHNNFVAKNDEAKVHVAGIIEAYQKRGELGVSSRLRSIHAAYETRTTMNSSWLNVIIVGGKLSKEWEELVFGPLHKEWTSLQVSIQHYTWDVKQTSGLPNCDLIIYVADRTDQLAYVWLF